MRASMAQAAVQESLSRMAIRSKRKPEEVRPVGDQVMVLADSPSAMTRSGLYIPETAQKHEGYLRTGVVVAVGLGDILQDGSRGPMHSKIGDHVIYDQASNRVVMLDGVEYLILHDEQHIWGLVEDE